MSAMQTNCCELVLAITNFIVMVVKKISKIISPFFAKFEVTLPHHSIMVSCQCFLIPMSKVWMYVKICGFFIFSSLILI